MGPNKDLTALEKYALDQQLALDVPVEWWRFGRLWVRIALAMATRPPGRRDVIVDALAGLRDEPRAVRARQSDDERARRAALREAGCHAG